MSTSKGPPITKIMRSKLIFAGIAGVAVVTIGGAVLLSSYHRTDIPATEPTSIPSMPLDFAPSNDPNCATENGEVTRQNIPIVDPAKLPALKHIELRDDAWIDTVRVTKPLNTDPTVDKSHPEYITMGDGDFYECARGIAFRNDRTISIEVEDSMTGIIRTISFGRRQGECNRFLYLDPMVAEDGIPADGYVFAFEKPQSRDGSSDILCFSQVVPEGAKSVSYIRQSYTGDLTLDIIKDARYSKPYEPGAVWFTPDVLTEDSYINVRVYHPCGDLVAVLRLTVGIEPTERSYIFTNIENRNLLASPIGDYDADEMDYIMELATDTWLSPDLVHLHVFDGDDRKAMDFSITESNAIIELLDLESPGLYFNEFVPASGPRTTRNYVGPGIQNIAVTYREYGMPCQTMYFQINARPYDSHHGKYAFIGRDLTSGRIVSN